MENNAKIIRFISILTIIVAGALTLLREVTMDAADRNEDIFNKRGVLAAVVSKIGDGTKSIKDFSNQEILDVFNNQIEQTVIKIDGSEVEDLKAEEVKMEKEKKKPEAERIFPLYTLSKGEETYYILAVRGSGLWDEIWGYIALESDLNTIAGASFDHKGETPGMGAEIKDNPNFPKSFEGKQIYDEFGEYVSVEVKKGGAEEGNLHQVDAITGATITCNGVTEMLVRGIKYYDEYLMTIMN